MTADLTNNGVSNTTITNNGATIDASGKLGKCYYFNGSSHLLGTNAPFDNDTDEFTVACWIKVVSSHTGCIYSNRTGTSQNGITIFWYSGSFIFDDGVRWQFIPNTTIENNVWYHLTFTRKKGVGKFFYINGILDSSTTSTGTPTVANATHFAIGNSQQSSTSVGGNPLNAYLNDVRLYTRCLSPNEIEILSRGLVVHYPLSLPQENIAPTSYAEERTYSYPTGSSLTDRWATTTSIIPSASQYVLSFWAKSTHSGDKIRAHYYSPNTTTRCETNQGTVTTASDGNIEITLSDKWEKYWIIYTQSSTTAVKRIILPRMAGPDSTHTCRGTGTVSIKLVKFEEGTIPTPWIPCSTDVGYSTMGFNDTTEYDVSGYNYHGTKVGTLTYDSDTPRYSACTTFDGASVINCGNDYNVQGAKNMSISLWAYLPDWAISTKQVFISSQQSGGFFIQRGSGTSVSFRCNYYNAEDLSSHTYSTITHACTLTGWHMLTATYDTSAIRLYVDGVQATSASLSGSYGVYFNPATSVNTYIGAEATGSSYESPVTSGCKISDVRIYYTTLTDDQVERLYNTPVSLSNNGTLLTQGEFVET